MSERAQRIGANEALFRTVNEQIETLNKPFAEISDNTMHVVCECGDLDCAEQFAVTVEKYEQTRADPSLFLIKPGHEIPDVEDVVESTDRVAVVRKKPGEPGQIAAQTNPRPS
jgi:hypothetical protein